MRLLDNCVAFDPLSRMKNLNESDVTDNFGVRIVHKLTKDVQYQNLLGMNVLTLRI